MRYPCTDTPDRTNPRFQLVEKLVVLSKLLKLTSVTKGTLIEFTPPAFKPPHDEVKYGAYCNPSVVPLVMKAYQNLNS